ncbi:uncharacterized protein Tco025E_03056 [Trypanosoma conorhini]|uniref:Zeta toxin domain-containing protein n=1 Tax=Trypanosoma conorhini TaxID=83891 RepID=A0A3R7PN86_9TRYP|nr:uncharacterized protein Tco025E_03056 [Trypanosoma conorhini]RNF22579.1 hypothetical protein Tco025E_03056 [Trypanosoma conorhini]
MLFLTRSDPELLRSLCHKWAIRFSKDRATLVARLRRRVRNSLGLPPASVSSADSPTNLHPGPKLCDPDECVEHFLRLVNTLVPMYFSWNWHRTEDVININKEYELYVRHNILPMCMATDPEEASDGEESFSLFPPHPSSCASEKFFDPVALVPCRQPGDETKHGPLDSPLPSFASIGNLLGRIKSSPHGLVLIFHARFSAKSCMAMSIFQSILQRQLLNPQPSVSVVHVVAEPELANMFKISWFPTIIYMPALAPDELARSLCEETPSTPECTSAEPATGFLVRCDNGLSTGAVRMSALSNSKPSVSEVLYGLPLCSSSLSSSIMHESSVSEEELSCIIGRGLHRTYPANAAITIPAIVEWINSKGEIFPRTKDDEDFVSRINDLREDEKFQKYREMVSAVVMLRQLQCRSNNNCRVAEGEAPVFIFMGGGMAAGKSTAATALSRSAWWEKNKDNIVLVNADDFKVAMAPWSQGVKAMHESSTRAAEKLLVRAINQGRNIVFDSTMMWRPFIQQVIDMVRHAHTTLYQQGIGYKDNGAFEEYFKPLGPRSVPLSMPYEIRMLAITVEPEVAVPRGILRLFATGRGVPIPMQLRSFRLFSESFGTYMEWVDKVTLFNNNVYVELKKGELPPILAEKTEEGLFIHDEEAYALFLRHRLLNDDADNILELYPDNNI